MTNKTAILFNYAKKVSFTTAETVTSPVTTPTLVAGLSNLETLGYTLSTETVKYVLDNVNTADFVSAIKALTSAIRDSKGANFRYAPMYPNFPQQVADASWAELWINAHMHYFGDAVGLRITPAYEKEIRQAITKFPDLKIINLGDENDVKNIYTNLLRSKVSLSESDYTVIDWFLDEYGDSLTGITPGTIPNKEVLAAYAAKTYNRVSGNANNPYYESSRVLFESIVHRCETATDVLRVAAAVSGASSALTGNVRFINFPKAIRRVFLKKLEQIASTGFNTVSEDMLRNKALWKILGEKLHPGSYAGVYPKTYAAFQAVRNNEKVETFNNRVESALKSKNVVHAVDILSARPGEFARRLDHLLRLTGSVKEDNYVLDEFRKVAARVSTNVLWQARNHFLERGLSTSDIRTFFPKGNVNKAQSVKNTLPDLSASVISEVVDIINKAVKKNYSQKEELGSVYVSPELSNFTVPNVLRNASRDVNTVGRGSRVDLGDGGTVRFFIWWKDGAGRTDLDLSAVFLNHKYETVGSVSYTNLRLFGGLHSGDITSAPHGASEFIDVPVAALLKKDVRYVMMVVNSYTYQSFVELPECFAGVMMRAEPGSGEVYDPKTVTNGFDLTADTQIAVPLIIDLKERKSIWVDLGLTRNPEHVNNIHGNSSSLSALSEAVITKQHTSLYDLFVAHAEARGKLVATAEEADTVFTVEQGHPNVSVDTIISQYL